MKELESHFQEMDNLAESYGKRAGNLDSIARSKAPYQMIHEIISEKDSINRYYDILGIWDGSCTEIEEKRSLAESLDKKLRYCVKRSAKNLDRDFSRSRNQEQKNQLAKIYEKMTVNFEYFPLISRIEGYLVRKRRGLKKSRFPKAAAVLLAGILSLSVYTFAKDNLYVKRFIRERAQAEQNCAEAEKEFFNSEQMLYKTLEDVLEKLRDKKSDQ